jgi:hypothetical protein
MKKSSAIKVLCIKKKKILVYKILATIMCVNFFLEKKKCRVLYTYCIIVIYEPSARRHFSHMSSLFEARATKERVLHSGECAETFSRFEVVQYFLKQTLCPICRVPFVNRWCLSRRLPKYQSN